MTDTETNTACLPLSGVKYAVRYDAIDGHYDGCAKIQIEAVNTADFPIMQLDWPIACLCRVREYNFRTPQPITRIRH